MSRALNEFLIRLYGFAEKREKAVQFDRAIALDCLRSDFDASIHCSFFVNVFEDDTLVLSYAGNHPRNATVDSLGAPFLRRFRLERETPDALRELAAAYKKIRPPAGEKSWLVSRKEVAAQLEQLAQSLEEFLRSRPTI
jgi:hypothetical protein